MSEYWVTIVGIICLTFSLTMCSVSSDWRMVEQQKIQLEREKAGLNK